VSKSITADELAQGSQFTSRYVAKTDEEYRWVPAGAFVAGIGAPSVANIFIDNFGIGFCWNLDSAGTESISSSVMLPDYWSTFHADLYWVNATTNAGNVHVALYRDFASDGDTVDQGVSGSSLTFAAPTTVSQIKVSRVATSQSVTTGKPLFLSLIRFGADAADTLANDIGIHGVLFTRAS
jgi:hypothetical protein